MTRPRPAHLRALGGVATGILLLGPLSGAALAACPAGGGHGGDHSAGRSAGHSAGRGTSHGGPSGHDQRHDQGHDQGQRPDHTSAPGRDQHQPQSHAKPHQHAKPKPHPASPQPSTGSHNPPGNNGTVKIAGPGDAVGTPSNNPHPGCTVVVEWFGYDAGSDVVSSVTFTPQAPTADVTIGGTAPAQVFVGGDDAGGGTDLDGRQAYDLTFTGTPHPQQGYHVKLTVATPHSLGNDTKTKVFWVQPCDTTGATESPAPTATPTPAQDTAPERGIGTAISASASPSSSPSSSSGPDRDVAGISASTGPAKDAAGSNSAVPTAVDAGEDAALPDWARSPLPLALLGGGVALAGAAVLSRRRSRA